MDIDTIRQLIQEIGFPGVIVLIFFAISFINARAKEKSAPNFESLSNAISKLAEDNNKRLIESEADRARLIERVGQLELSAAVSKLHMDMAENRLRTIEEKHAEERVVLQSRIATLEDEVKKLKTALDYSDDEKLALAKENELLRNRVIALEHEVETLKDRIRNLQRPDSPTAEDLEPQSEIPPII